jgi:hypothetical protein
MELLGDLAMGAFVVVVWVARARFVRTVRRWPF